MCLWDIQLIALQYIFTHVKQKHLVVKGLNNEFGGVA